MGLDDPTLGEIGREQEVAVQIRKLLKENDMAGYVVIAGRQSATFSLCLDPEWMKLQAMEEGDGQSSFRMRSKKEDYNGDTEAQRRDLESTMGFLLQVGTMSGEMAMNLLRLHEYFNKSVHAEHSESVFVPFQKK